MFSGTSQGFLTAKTKPLLLVIVSIPTAVAVGVLATLRPALTFVAIGVTALAVLSLRKGVWPIAIVFLWFSAIGTGLDSGVLIGGANVPVTYVLMAGMAIVSLVRVSDRHLPGEPTLRQISPTLARYLAAILIPAMLFSLVGIARGNSPPVVRQEALLWAVAALMTTVTLLNLRSRNLTGLSLVFLVAATVAAIKTILIQISGTLTAVPGLLQAYSSVNPQFGVQRVIPVGGDTLMVLGIPVAIGLLRVVRGKALMVIIIALSIDALGLGLTYTRTLIGAAAVGAFIALAAPLGAGVRRAAVLVRMAAAIAVISLLLGFTFGQSDLTAGQALATRFLGGHEVGASSLQQRVDDANAALGGGDPKVILLGRGIGASYYSPITPLAGPTPYVHVGYVWLAMQGGVLLALLVAVGIFLAFRIYWKAASSSNGRAAGALAGLAGSVAAFAATNVLVNRFDSVEGAAFTGTVLGSALLLRLAEPKTGEGNTLAEATGRESES